MKNKQKILFVVLMLIFGAILLNRYLYENRNVLDARSVENNNVKTMVLKPNIEYTVGKDGFKEGYYDIEVKGNNTSAFGYSLNGKRMILGRGFVNNNKTEITDGVEAVLKPAKFEPLKFKNGVAELKNTVFTFECGNEIDPGSYIISVDIATNKGAFNIYTENSDGSQDDSTDAAMAFVDSKNPGQVTFKKGQIITMMSTDVMDDFIIRFKKVS